MNFTEILANASAEYGIVLSPKQLHAFDVYKDLLLQWNEKINLTAITDPQEVAVKHMVDSLTCYDINIFPENCSVIDVGTGAGFPGLPLKIVRPDINLTLLDSLNKRLVFLQDVVDKLGLSKVTLLHARAEEAGHMFEHRQRYHVALSRAVARLNILAELCLPLVQCGGYFISLKGSKYKEEVTEADRAITTFGGKITNIKPVQLPGLDDGRVVLYIQKGKATPVNYPRRPGIPEKKPII